MLSTSAGFQALTMCRLEFGLVLMLSTTRPIWSMRSPPGAGQERHCAP